MGRRVSRIASSSSVPVAVVMLRWGFSEGEVGEVGAEPEHRGRRTMRAFVQAFRRAVKHRSPSL